MCVQGTKPDDVMFIAVLSACNHGGLVEEARSGDLDEAVRLTESMDMVPNAVIWGTLIGACKVHGNDTLFEYVTKKVLNHGPSGPSYLTLITNLSSSTGRWQDSLRFRWEMRRQGI
ncbi:pentatricopeptide repeat-containing protein [Tanacetum coccineum]